MNEFENGYYWVSYQGMLPIIAEKNNETWYCMGSEIYDITEYKVLGEVSEWGGTSDDKCTLHSVISRNPTCIDCAKKFGVTGHGYQCCYTDTDQSIRVGLCGLPLKKYSY